jgi:hypothetical protein
MATLAGRVVVSDLWQGATVSMPIRFVNNQPKHAPANEVAGQGVFSLT